MKRTQGTGAQQDPSGHSYAESWSPEKERNASTATCSTELGCQGVRCSALLCLEKHGSHAVWPLQRSAWPCLKSFPKPYGAGRPAPALLSLSHSHAACHGLQELPCMALLPSTALCSPVTVLSHFLINQADCNVFLGH